MLRITSLAVLTAIGLCGLAGCGGKDNTADAVAAMNTSNPQRLANMYAAHQNMKGGKGPKSEEEFKDWIRNYDAEKLKMMGIDPGALDQLFTSENDGKPFKVRYNVGGGRGSVDPVIFEQTGTNGKKRVAYTGGKVEEVDDATAAQLFAGKTGKSSQGGRADASNKGAGRPSGIPAGAPTGPGQ